MKQKRHQVHFLPSRRVECFYILRQMFSLQPSNWTESKSFQIFRPSRCLEAVREFQDKPSSSRFIKFTRVLFVFSVFKEKKIISINHYCFAVYKHDKKKLSMESNDRFTEWSMGCTQNAKLYFKLERLSTPSVLNYLLFPTASSKLCWKLFAFFFFCHRGI